MCVDKTLVVKVDICEGMNCNIQVKWSFKGDVESNAIVSIIWLNCFQFVLPWGIRLVIFCNNWNVVKGVSDIGVYKYVFMGINPIYKIDIKHCTRIDD